MAEVIRGRGGSGAEVSVNQTIYIKMSIKLHFSVTCILYRRKLPGITQVLNVYVIHIKFLQNASFLRKLNPLNFALTY